MMAQSQEESTWEISNYGRFINKFPPNIIRSIRQFERIDKKYVDKRCLCSYIHIYIYAYICMCVYIHIVEYIQITKRLEKKLDGNYTRMLRAILNKSWQRHPTRHQLYGHLPPITKSIQVRRTRHAGHCWRSRDELIRDVLLWIPTHGRAKAGRPARTYIQQLCELQDVVLKTCLGQ